MNKYEVACPACSMLIWISSDVVGDQMNCPGCSEIFDVPPRLLPASAGPIGLRLEADPHMSDLNLSSYETLASHGVTTDSSMEAIRRVFPGSDQEFKAQEQLFLTHSRLTIDLFMYPIWLKEEHADGPE